MFRIATNFANIKLLSRGSPDNVREVSPKPSVYIGLTADLLHPGIFNVIKAASNLGAVTVGLLTDAALVGHKPLPVFTWEQRLAMIRDISGVSDVVAQTEWSYAPNILKLRPDFFRAR